MYSNYYDRQRKKNVNMYTGSIQPEPYRDVTDMIQKYRGFLNICTKFWNNTSH